MNDATPQQKYQVRFDWGLGGFRALAGSADVVILADALVSPGADTAFAASPKAAAAAAPASAVTPGATASNVVSAASSAEPAAPRVIAVTLTNRTAVAEWVLARQTEKGGRFSVAVIAVGQVRGDGSFAPSVEDLLAAGAVIDALSSLGIDHCSPEAAAASAAFVGLRQALKHLVSASEAGQVLAALGRGDEVKAAAILDASTVVAERRDVALPYP